MRIPKSCLSVRLYPEKRNHPIFVNISSIVVNDMVHVYMNGNVFTSTTVTTTVAMETQKFFFFKKRSKSNIDVYLDLFR